MEWSEVVDIESFSITNTRPSVEQFLSVTGLWLFMFHESLSLLVPMGSESLEYADRKIMQQKQQVGRK